MLPIDHVHKPFHHRVSRLRAFAQQPVLTKSIRSKKVGYFATSLFRSKVVQRWIPFPVSGYCVAIFGFIVVAKIPFFRWCTALFVQMSNHSGQTAFSSLVIR
jgi:hypothetical protein